MRAWTAVVVVILAAVLPLPSGASSTGPFLGANGIPGGTTCDTGGCHGGPPQDAAQGSVRILGLPAQWAPDTNYNLQVVVQRPTARRFGFQLSAILSNGRQAGSLSSTDPRISIVMGFSLTTPFPGQYAQHNDAPFGSAQWTFPVTWRSPSSVSSGDVTFYIGGNAANGDGSNSGDAIYLTNVRVPPVDITTLSSHSYSIKNPGSVTWKTDGNGASISVGYARVIPDTGSGAPSGLSVFGLRANNVLVTETSVAASALIRSGRIYAETRSSTGVSTGIAVANPNSQAATVDFFFTDSSGTDFASGSVIVPANGQIAKFLYESPFNGGTNVQGTLTFSSNVPISVTALRGLTNERGEFLLTTLPVTDVSAAAPTDMQVLAHYAAGGGWTTEIILVNPSDNAIAGAVEFYSPGDGTTPGTLVNRATYSIPRRSSQKIVAGLSSANAITGSVRVVPDSGSVSPVSMAIFAFKPANNTLALAAVPAARGSAFRMYAESAGNVPTIQTGLAIANASGAPAPVSVELYGFDGTLVSGPVSLTVPAFGQVAKFMNEIFPGSTQPFQGVLRIAGQATAQLSVIGLRGRYNERSDFIFTTIPVAPEQPAPTVEFLFPQLANGGGYTTQFVLFNSGFDSVVSGVLGLFQQDGAALNLTLN